MVGGMEISPDGDRATCDWQVRNVAAWRDGIVFSASADLLAAWHRARVTMPQRAQAAMDRQLDVLVDGVRQARLTSDVDEIESACEILLWHAAGHATPADLRQALVDLREMLD